MRCWSKWSGPLRGSVFVAALSLSVPAGAQSADAGPVPAEPVPAEPVPAEPVPAEPVPAEPPADPADPAGSEAPADPGAGAAAGEPEQPAPPPGLKTLSANQRLPENLQGWMRERQRRNPALVARRPVAAPQPSVVPELAEDDPTVEVLKRRLRSFSEGGVTVLSNRHEATGPVAPQVTRVAAAAAVSRPAPVAEPLADAPDVPEPEESAVEAPSVETRSLRAQSSPSSRRAAEDATPQWPAWLAVCAALGLVVVWLRKRRVAA